MKTYIDLYILTVKKKDLPAYVKLAEKYAAVVRDYGVLEHREFVGDDLNNKMGGSFLKLVPLKPGEVMISSYVSYRSRKHRDEATKKTINDPRMKAMMDLAMPFDMKRFYFGGFDSIFEMKLRTKKVKKGKRGTSDTSKRKSIKRSR